MCAKFVSLLLLDSLPVPPSFFFFFFFPHSSCFLLLTSKQSCFSWVFMMKLNATLSQWPVVEEKWLTAKPELMLCQRTALAEVLFAHFGKRLGRFKFKWTMQVSRRDTIFLFFSKSQILWIWKSGSSWNNPTNEKDRLHAIFNVLYVTVRVFRHKLVVSDNK